MVCGVEYKLNHGSLLLAINDKCSTPLSALEPSVVAIGDSTFNKVHAAYCPREALIAKGKAFVFRKISFCHERVDSLEIDPLVLEGRFTQQQSLCRPLHIMFANGRCRL